MKNKNIRILLFLLTFVLPLSAQEPAADTPLSAIEILGRRAEAFGRKIPQEKVFVHLDNTCYFAGDTIWYKGYVVRSDKGTPTDLSRILYVELLTPDGYLVERQQLEMRDGTAHGAFCLQDSLYAGYYEVRAYTRWMLNFGRSEHPHSRWTEEKFYSRRMAKDFFRDYDKLYSRVFPVFDRPDDRESYPKDMTLRPMRRYYKSPKGKPQLDVRFYPEGGELVAGTPARVAFEANTAEGEHLDLEIAIQDRNGQEVARARTVHRGRGLFTLPRIDGQGDYKAVFRHAGYDYTVSLPRPAAEGCALSATLHDDVLQLEISASGVAQDEPLGLQLLHCGVPHTFRTVSLNGQGQLRIDLPAAEMATGIHQIVLFDASGRIHADRLVFVNHHDHDRPRISVEGVQSEYAPFEAVDLRLRLNDTTGLKPRISLAVRDRTTDETTYDNGNILTEMLLSSELKGFVETPAYYFEADDEEHRRALDLLMLVQGWRRYSWRIMAGAEPFELDYMPEQEQTIAGCVNRVEEFRMDRSEYASEASWEPGSGTMDYSLDERLQDVPSALQDQKTTDGENENELGIVPEEQESFEQRAQQENHIYFYGWRSSNLRKEVNVWPTFIQGDDMLELMQTTENGTFYMQTPELYGDCILFLSASDRDKGTDYMIKSRQKDYTNEEAFPEYYVKLNRFYPVFPKPYNYYQQAEVEGWAGDTDEADGPSPFAAERTLGTVVVRSKKGGLRKLDLSKPAMVVDAYEAFNLTADYGLNAGTHNWITFPQQVALAYVGDMGMDRDYFLQVRYDGRAINEKSSQRSIAPAKMLNGERIEIPSPIRQSKNAMEKYHFLRNLDKVYIYTDYAPREQGSWKYAQDNQPDVTIDLHTFPGDAMQRTYRDRRYILPGYAVCDDFYSPDYSRAPLPDTKDYRRTLYWAPEVEFDGQGEAGVRLYNNGSPSVLSIDIEGLTGDGQPVVWEKKR